MMLFNGHIRALLLQIGRGPVIINDDEFYKALTSRKEVNTTKMILTKTLHYFSGIYSNSPDGGLGSLDTWHDH